MALPTSRNTTYTPVAPVKSADLNAIQDCIIGGKHGDKVLQLRPHDGKEISGGGTWTINDADIAAPASGAPTWHIGLPLSVGDRIKSVAFRYQRLGGTLAFALKRTDILTSTPAFIANTTDNSTSGLQTLTLAAINHTVAANNPVYVFFGGGGAAADKLLAVIVTYDRP